MNFSEKDQSYFWDTWKFNSKNGQQSWEFKLPDDLKGIIESESDWDKPEGKAFLEAFDKAFVFDKKINPNSADRVFRYIRNKQVGEPKLEYVSPKNTR